MAERFLRGEAAVCMACRPLVDPSILIHRDPGAWKELLGCVDVFISRLRPWGVSDLYTLVEFSFSKPVFMWMSLRGVEFVGSLAGCGGGG